jgi:hypothetical protein
MSEARLNLNKNGNRVLKCKRPVPSTTVVKGSAKYALLKVTRSSVLRRKVVGRNSNQVCYIDILVYHNY